MRFAVVSDIINVWEHLNKALEFQSALRFAVVSDDGLVRLGAVKPFQSALRFAVVSDVTDELRFRGAGIRFNPL